MNVRRLGKTRITTKRIHELSDRILKVGPDSNEAWEKCMEEAKGMASNNELDEADIVKAIQQTKTYLHVYDTGGAGHRAIRTQYHNALGAWLHAQLKRATLEMLVSRCKQALGEISMGEYTSVANMCLRKIKTKIGEAERLKARVGEIDGGLDNGRYFGEFWGEKIT